MSNQKNIIGQRIKFARESCGYTQEQLAEQLGTLRQIISYWESGSRKPSADMFIKMSKIFNVTTDYLLGVDLREMTNLEKECIACEFLGMNKIQLCSMQAIFTALETHEVINEFVKLLGEAAELARKEGKK